jgi:HAD superfamily hydrolase (TIGR01549 family)
VLIFDCDGVIFDTNKLKLDAFKATLSKFNEDHINEFLEYLILNFGRSRYAHIHFFIEDILKIPFDEKLFDQLVLNYGLRCQTLYSEAELCTGAVELLKELKNVVKYIASGSDQSELRNVFRSKSLGSYFKAIYGSPRSKIDLVKEICNRHEGQDILMIGDAYADFLAAKHAQIDFLYVERYSNDKSNMKRLSIKENFSSILDLSAIIGK